MLMCLLPFLESLASRLRFTWRASEFKRVYVDVIESNLINMSSINL